MPNLPLTNEELFDQINEQLFEQRVAWNRLEDLRNLVFLRKGVHENARVHYLFWMSSFLWASGATSGVLGLFVNEVQELAYEIHFPQNRVLNLVHDALAYCFDRLGDPTDPPIPVEKLTDEDFNELFYVTEAEQKILQTMRWRNIRIGNTDIE